MRAIRCHEFSGIGALRLDEIRDPEPGPGELLVRVRACGLNFADTLLVAGRYQARPELPFTPGAELAGEVVTIGDGVERFAPGDRVVAVVETGGLAELAVVPAATAMPLPDGLDLTTAAAIPIAYGTAHLALTDRAELEDGETLLVHGAAGGVGLAAVELGKRLGATVVATASSPEKRALAARYGADHQIDYSTGPFRPAVLELTDGRGADVIFDPVGGDVFDESVRTLAWGGRLLVIGFASGRIPTLEINRVLLRNSSVMGLFWGSYARHRPRIMQRSLQTLFKMAAQGEIRPHISATYPLERAPEGLEALANRSATGKLVVVTGGEMRDA